MTRDELKCVSDIAVDHKLTVMCDELWEDIVFDGRKHISLASLSPDIADRTITAFGFSKTYGVAGLQIGYAVATNKMIMNKIKKIGIRVASDVNEPALRGTGSLALAAARAMLSHRVHYYVQQLVAYLQEARDFTYQRFSTMEWVRLTPLEGTYLIFPDLSACRMSSAELTDYLLNKAKVAVESGSAFGPSGEGHIRINIGTSKEILTEALNRIETALEALRVKPA